MPVNPQQLLISMRGDDPVAGTGLFAALLLLASGTGARVRRKKPPQGRGRARTAARLGLGAVVSG